MSTPGFSSCRGPTGPSGTTMGDDPWRAIALYVPHSALLPPRREDPRTTRPPHLVTTRATSSPSRESLASTVTSTPFPCHRALARQAPSTARSCQRFRMAGVTPALESRQVLGTLDDVDPPGAAQGLDEPMHERGTERDLGAPEPGFGIRAEKLHWSRATVLTGPYAPVSSASARLTSSTSASSAGSGSYRKFR